MNHDPSFVPVETLGHRPPRYWQSLAERRGEVAPEQEADHLDDAEPPEMQGESRRHFMSLMAASLALAGTAGCTRQPPEAIMPYVDPPENVIPGRPRYYATAALRNGIGLGVVVESHLGRPTKVEGNPKHPASLGATDVHAQSCLLDLYDPDRAKTITRRGEPQSWDDFLIVLQQLLPAVRGNGRLRILSETVVSPVLGAQIQGMLKAFPGSRWHQYDPAGPHSAREGARRAFGRPVNTYYRLDRADVILALDSDFLASGPESTRYARDFADRRRVRGAQTSMNRLYSVECVMSSTGGKADHRFPLHYDETEQFAFQLLNAVSGGTAGGPAWAQAIARDLMAHRGASAVIPGECQSPAVHALAHAINGALGNAGVTVIHTDPLEVRPEDQVASLGQLITDMNSGAVDVLLILGGNPVYSAPADWNFRDALRKVAHSIHLGTHLNETSAWCEWHLPESHFLEEWGDTRAYDGTVTILQPLILPLYETRSAAAVLDAMLQNPGRPGYQIVRDYWASQARGDFDAWWRQSVRDGMAAGSALPAITITAATPPAPSQPAARQTAVVFRPDPYLYDGRFSNNAWLKELPRPITKLMWDNGVVMSAATARKHGLDNHEVVEIRSGGRGVRGPVWIQPGMPEDVLELHLGFGRTRAGRYGNGFGFDAYPLRTSSAPWWQTGVELRRTGDKSLLAPYQWNHSIEGREDEILVTADVEHYRGDPNFVRAAHKEPERDETLYPLWNNENSAWGMSIDMTACVNCMACVMACQAENNIPIVGRPDTLNHRAMHWLRVDVYYEGSEEQPEAHYQPVPCMQCEQAPCELVCPVQATVHSADGLNDMVYNRCVGTRYCSNNCPYKVRRFNFYLYSDWYTEALKLQRNPDVTVRSRGVMEKCTYCVQRIREGEIRAQTEGRRIRDGEVQTACQQVCPTQAIVFGDINDRDSRVRRLKQENLNYAMLAELNTRPRTTYLAELRNHNPEIKGA